MNSKKKILVAPLNWGLGHASRCVPIINQLMELNCEVIIAADGEALLFLEKEFPDLKLICLPDINLRYSTILPISLHLILKLPGFYTAIKKENKRINEIIRQFNIDAIISDNRYGLYSKSIPSVLITHQLNIQAPFFRVVANHLLEHLISKFDQCWVPDYKGELNLSGALSHSSTNIKNITYIGPQSRFEVIDSQFKAARSLIVILSGPEPSRSIFEKVILDQLESLNKEVLIVRGKVNEGKKTVKLNKNITTIGHLTAKELQKEIINSKVVLSRSGYTSVMDLYILGKRAILVPTPGQIEQEYLSKYLSGKGIFYCVKQSRLNIKQDFEKALEIIPSMEVMSCDILNKTIKNWLNEL